jgi:hypothetical protein
MVDGAGKRPRSVGNLAACAAPQTVLLCVVVVVVLSALAAQRKESGGSSKRHTHHKCLHKSLTSLVDGRIQLPHSQREVRHSDRS